jgi:hypothetical protein
MQSLIKAWESGGAQKMTALQRVLLVTDGNLTVALEAAFLETIRVQKVSQCEVPLRGPTCVQALHRWTNQDMRGLPPREVRVKDK